MALNSTKLFDSRFPNQPKCQFRGAVHKTVNPPKHKDLEQQIRPNHFFFILSSDVVMASQLETKMFDRMAHLKRRT